MSPAAPARAQPLVSVIIPSYNRRESLRSVLDGLAQQRSADTRLEVVVVLDGSDDGSREMLSAGGWDLDLRVAWQPNHGAGRARNHGAALARGELLLFLDDDVVPRPDLIRAHVEAHRTGAGEVILGRMLFSTLGLRTVISRWDEEWYERHFAELAEPDYAFSCWDLFAGNLSIPRRVFLEIGGFDERFTTYGCEDWELGLRLLKAGHRFAFCGDAIGEHRSTVDFGTWRHHAYWDGRSEVRFARKFPEIKPALQLTNYYQGSLKRRIATRLLGRTPGIFPSLIRSLVPLYHRAERDGNHRLAARLAKVLWAETYWRGLCDELGGAAAVRAFIGFQVPVLAYHRVTERPHPALAEYAVSPRTFRRQLAWLRQRGYHVISIEALFDAYRGVAPLPTRPVVITFDDGYADTATVAAPILREFGYPAVVFAVADLVGGHADWDAHVGAPAPLATWAQLRELANTGIEIGGHSATHARLPGLGASALAREVGGSRATIERELERPVRWFAYPYGDYDEPVRAAAGTYQAAFTFGGGFATACDDLYLLNRIPVAEADGLVGFAFKLLSGDDWRTAVKRRVPLPLKTAVRGTLRPLLA